MTNPEALQEKIPFQLIPTNIPGAYTSPAPPEDFDPLTASSARLIKHGLLLHRPTESDHPALVRAWQEAFSREWHAKDRVVPKFEVRRGKTHHLRKPPRKVTEGSYLSYRWSGAVVSGGPWTGVMAFWNVPTVSQPSERAGTQGGWNSSSWIGIDGYSLPVNDVLQAGIQQEVDATGQPTYSAWYEWYVTPPPTDTFPGPYDSNGYPESWTSAPEGSYQYIYQTDIYGMSVSPGDQIYCSVQYVNNNAAGYILFVNLTTGKVLTILLQPPPTASFNGSSAEWIMENPDGGEPLSSLAAFTPVTFTNALACNPDPYTTPILAVDFTNPLNADTLNMETASGEVLTSVTTGLLTATINFIG